MKQKFTIPNLITQKRRLDKRFAVTQFIKRWFNKETRAALVAGLIVGTLLGFALFYPYKTSPEVLKQSFEVKAVETTIQEKDWSTELVGYFRFRGMEIGYDEYDITKLHGVLDCENGTHDPLRKNYMYDGENGHYTAGGFTMITNTTWKQHKCTGSKWDGVANINCFYKIIGKNQLSDYKESKHCWSPKFNVNSIYFIEVK
jgi:hypothetical protein